MLDSYPALSGCTYYTRQFCSMASGPPWRNSAGRLRTPSLIKGFEPQNVIPCSFAYAACRLALVRLSLAAMSARFAPPLYLA